MPSRTYNILAAGKPILAIVENDTELTQVIEEENVGWSVAPGDAGILLDKILEIYHKRNELDELGSRARDAALAKYSLATALEKYRVELV